MKLVTPPLPWLAHCLFPVLAIGLTPVSLVAESGDTIGPAPEITRVAESLTRTIGEQIRVKDIPALSIALVEDQRILWAAGFGTARTEPQQPATAQTIYRVGSVSKLLTDLAVMQLVDRGELDLDAPVTEYLPAFRPHNPFEIPLTLRMLMSHRSGLVREPPVGHYFDPTEPSLAETVASLNGTALVYEPKTRTKYSNAAIAVVGQILAEVTGQPFAPRMRETILRPLGMASADFVDSDTVRGRLAEARMWTYDGRSFAAPEFLLGTGPAGNLYASVIDLAQLHKFLFRGGTTVAGAPLLRRDTLERMWQPQFDDSNRFGLGFAVSQLDDHLKISHGGAVYGFSTQFSALPERKLGVAVAASRDVSNGIVSRIADHALRLALAQTEGRSLPDFPVSGPIPEELVLALAGVYRHDDDELRLEASDGGVFLHRGSVRNKLRMRGNDFVVDDVLSYGPVVKRLSTDELQLGEDVYIREDDPLPDDVPQRWRGLIGEYGWDHNTLYILENHGQLHCLIEWIYDYPLTEVSPDVYAFPDYGLYHGERVVFARDDRGRALRAVAAGVTFERREVGPESGETFRITPLLPMSELRPRAMQAQPPVEQRPRLPELVELVDLDDTIHLDIRYATTNNFMGAVFYRQPRAFLQQPAAEALVRAHRALKAHGYGLLIHDAYRPWFVTKMFYDATPDDLKDFVANPRNGSRHNRGCAVDLTLYELESGRPVEMVAGYDEFSPRAFPDYPGGTSRQRWYRRLLRDTMTRHGFRVYQFEWWHFDYRDWRLYPLLNVPFENLD